MNDTILVIPRAVKPAGLIFAARTYRIVLNDFGLYILHIGRAMGNKPMPKGYFEKKLTDSLVTKIESKMMKQLFEREKDIDDSNLTDELTSDKSQHFSSPSEVKLSFKQQARGSVKLIVKGKGIHLKLNLSSDDADTAQQIANQFSQT